MKKWLIIFLVLIIQQIVHSQNHFVKDYEVARAASNWIRENYPSYPDTIRYLFCFLSTDGCPLMYEIQTDSVSLVMSASKACLPILATYKDIGNRSLLKEYDSHNLPCCMMEFIDSYVFQLEMAYKNDDRVLYFEREWDELISGSRMTPRSVTQVGPLLNSVWSQWISNCGRDSNAYNYYAPSRDMCNHCVAGCVAVAMGQVMNYWKYPLILPDMEQFDWCNMSSTLDTNMEMYHEKRNAVAYLLYECGIYVHMNYGCDGSSAQTEDSRDALVYGFRYSDDAHYSRKWGNYTDEQWMEKIRNNINWGFPVIMKGHGTAGHAFVCDGYNSNGMFCFNWGWGDRQLNNCFFSIRQLTPRDTNNYSKKQGGVFYIHPPLQTSMCSLNIQLDSFYSSCNIIVAGNYPPYLLTPQTATILSSASISSPAGYRTIPSGVTVAYRAHEEIVLQDGFEAEWGSDFTAEIVPCSACEDPSQHPIHPIFDSLFPQRQTEPDSLDGAIDAAFSHIEDFGFVQAEVYPNPASGELTVVTDGMAETVVIYNAMGHPIGGWEMLSLGENWLTLDVSALPQGAYIIVIRTPTAVSAARFLRR